MFGSLPPSFPLEYLLWGRIGVTNMKQEQWPQRPVRVPVLPVGLGQLPSGQESILFPEHRVIPGTHGAFGNIFSNMFKR